MNNVGLLERIKFLNKHRISADELLLLQVIRSKKDSKSFGVEVNKEYTAYMCDHTDKVRAMIESLQEKRIISASYKIPNKGEPLNLSEIPINASSERAYLKESYDMGEELFQVYPATGFDATYGSNLKAISSKFNSPEEAFAAYGKYINWDPEMHEHVLDLIKEAKETNYNFPTLGKFIVDRSWITLEEIYGDLRSNSTMRMV